MSYSPEDRLQLKVDDVVWRVVGDELVVLELSTSTYLTLNGTAKLLWETIASETTFGHLTGVLIATYGIATDHAQRDAEAFVAELVSRGLLLVER
jgi:hypothetical protein